MNFSLKFKKFFLNLKHRIDNHSSIAIKRAEKILKSSTEVLLWSGLETIKVLQMQLSELWTSEFVMCHI